MPTPLISGHTDLPSSPCVLIVDDEEDVRETLRDVVEMGGCLGILAASAREELDIIRKQKPCLVILDLLMPGMTGAEMLIEIQQDPSLSSLPVVMSTSAPARAPSGVPFLPKPVNLEQLFGWIHRSCECHPIRSTRSPQTIH